MKRDDEPPEAEPHAYLVDLDADMTHDLGSLQPQQFDGDPPAFDPNSRYAVRGGQVFSTLPFRHVCDLP